MFRLLAIALWSLAWFRTGAARAATPDIEYLFPSGGQQGTTIKVIVGSKADSKIAPWPAKAWIDCPGVVFTASESPGQFNVAVARDAPLGPHTVRIYNDDGASSPRVFIVGRHPEIDEKEPNDNIESAQPIKDLPSVVNGTLDKAGDADCYAVDVEAGKWLVAELQCRRLGSPCDPALRLVDTAGTVVAFNHDTYGLDPLIAYRAPRAGRYVIQIVGFVYPPGSEIRFAGSKSTVYRLNVTTGPYARFAYPPCVARDRKSTIKLYGWNLGPRDDPDPFQTPMEVEIDPTGLPAAQERVSVSPAGIDNVLRLPLIGLDASPVVVDGQLKSPGDVEQVAFDAREKERFTLIVKAESLNSPVDPMLVLTGPAGGELVREVGAGQDIHVDWTASATGRHTVSLSDIHRGGGPEYVYHLEIDRGSSDYSAKVDAPSYRLEAGKTANIQVTVKKRNGNRAPLKIETSDLRAGVTASSAEIPADGGAATVTLSAAADAEPANQPLRVWVRSNDADHPRIHVASFEPTADVLTLATDTPWLTVLPKGGDSTPEKGKKK